MAHCRLHHCLTVCSVGRNPCRNRVCDKAADIIGCGAECPLLTVLSTDRRNTLILNGEMECVVMRQRYRRGYTAAQKTELWDRWQRGESLKAIGRAFCKPSSSIYFQLAPHGGIQHLRSKRTIRRSRHANGKDDKRGQITDIVSISERRPRLKIGRCRVIGKAISSQDRRTVTL